MNDSAETKPLLEISNLLSQGDLPRAEARCRELISAQPRLVSALHLLGLIRARQGDVVEAERLLRRCTDLITDNADFHRNLGIFLCSNGRLREGESAIRRALALEPNDRPTLHRLALILQDLGQPGQAELTARTALDHDEHDSESWSTLGYLLNRQGRFAEAEDALRRSLELNPAQGVAEHNLALALVSTDRAEEALAALTQAALHGVSGFEWHVNRGRALIKLARLDAAVEAFAAAVSERPTDLDAHFTLARLRRLHGDPDYEDAISHAARDGADPELHWLESDILRRSRRVSAAEDRIRAAIQRLGRHPRLLSGLSQILLDQKRLAESEATAMDAAAALPEDSPVVENLVAVLLARGRPRDALQFIERWRTKKPLDQIWIAYESSALRALGRSESAMLNDYGRLVKLYDLSPPAGWADIEQLNSKLKAALEPRLILDHAPFEQEPRSGRCSTDDLNWSRTPVIQAALSWCVNLLPAYLSDIGVDPAHPLVVRNTGATHIAAARAVELRQGGYQRTHVSRHGWISAIYYVSVPDVEPERDARDGWLKLGQVPHSDPNSAPDCLVQPRAGRLVLFPTSFWRGVNPLTTAASQLAISFEAIPTTHVASRTRSSRQS